MSKKEKMRYKVMSAIIKKVESDTASIEAIFSTDDEDRHGDIVRQDWDLKSFKKNPVIMNSHNYQDATEVIGRASDVAVKDGKLQGKIVFAVDENPKAKIIYDLYAGGFLNAFSVGFIPKQFSDKGEILKSELLEVSAVSVPANAMALAKAKGIKVDELYENTKNGVDAGGEEDVIESEGAVEQSQSEETGEENADAIQDDTDATDEVEADGEDGTDGVETDDTDEDGEDDIETEDEDEEVVLTPEVQSEVEELQEEVEEEKTKKQILVNINKAIIALREKEKVETPVAPKQVNSEAKQLINKAVRNLLKLKS